MNVFCGAEGGNRTRDLYFTKVLLCQLSYFGTIFFLERDTGIGPASLAWEASILPLY